MLRKRAGRMWIWAGALASMAAGLLAPDGAAALGVVAYGHGDPIFELQLDPGPAGLLLDTYRCIGCDQASFDALTPPAGFSKVPVRTVVPNTATLDNLPTLPDFVGLDVGGIEFQLAARLVALPPPFGAGVEFPCAAPGQPGFCGVIVHLESDRSFVYDAGVEVTELSDGVNSWVLFAALDAESLASLVLPSGWSLSTRTLAAELRVDSGGYPDVYNDSGGNLWQRVALPEASTGGLAILTLLSLSDFLPGLRRRRLR